MLNGVTARRRLLTGSLLLAIAAWLVIVAGGWSGAPSPPPHVVEADDRRTASTIVATVLAIPSSDLARRIDAVKTASILEDAATLEETMHGTDAAAYLAARALAGLPTTDDTVRIAALERQIALHLEEPLDRTTLPALWLAIASIAERSGDLSRAADAFREALPHPEAIEGLLRTGSDPYRTAATLLDARVYEAALTALGTRTAPSVEAPALRALGRYEEASAAYDRWLRDDPTSDTAILGSAWTAWFLDDLDRAEERFSRVLGPSAWYGLGLIANRRGDVDAAAEWLLATGDPRRLWLATTLLERNESWSGAIDVYLRIAESDSPLADDAAYRARTLAERTGDDEARRAAEALLPTGSFFVVSETGVVALPTNDDLPRPHDEVLDAIAVVDWLVGSGDHDTARTVAQFAMRDAASEQDVVAVGEALTALGDHRTPARRAAAFVALGSPQLRTWRLAYPRAFPSLVPLESKRLGVDAELVWAIMKKESAFYPDAVSRSGAQGLMQVMPATWNWLAELQNESPGDPFDRDANVRYGATYLAYLLDYFAGDLTLAIASYNRGQGYVGRLFDGEDVRRDKDELYRAIDAEETREYLQDVFVTYRVYQELARVEASFR